MTDTNLPDAGYGLPEVFTALRRDFEQAQKNLLDENKQPLMTLGEVEVEIQFTVEHEKTGGGGLNLKVFGVGFEGKGEKSKSVSTAHTMVVKLNPVSSTGLLGGSS